MGPGGSFVRLAVPCVDDAHKLKPLRQQFVRSADRLALLNAQGNLCSDDEIAHHLGSLASGSAPFGGPYPAILTIDPLLSTAWLDDCAFPIERWACEHPEVLKRSVQVVGACRLAQHWVPFQIVPCGSHATVYTCDAPVNDHAWESCFGFGFCSVPISCQQRLFPVSDKRGALAMHSLHNAVHGTQRPINAAEAELVHQTVRRRFIDVVQKSEFVIRPWI